MIYVENHPLDDWMTQKKTGHSVEKQTIGSLDDPKKTGHTVEK